MSLAHANHQAAMSAKFGFEDTPALTLQSSEGDIPQGRELSFSWLAGIIMTGLTSVILMGGALYVSFLGQDTFSTPHDALQVETTKAASTFISATKTERLRPIVKTISERETIEASIRVNVEGENRIRNQPFDRIRSTLATTATSLSRNIPTYDPVALLNRTRSSSAALSTDLISTDIYGANVEGEIVVRTTPLPLDTMPQLLISDQGASEFVRLTVSGNFDPNEILALGYAAVNSSVVELEAETSNTIFGEAENVTTMPKTTLSSDQVLGRSERILTFRSPILLEDALKENGFTPNMITATLRALQNVFPSPTLPAGSHLRILFGPNRTNDTLIPYRTSIYVGDNHAATVALTDRSQYVLGLAPTEIDFPEEDIEEVNVNNLPSIYRSIWESGRKYNLSDNTIDRIVSLYAYDLNLNNRIHAGDSFEILQTEPDENGKQELLYISLKLNGTAREFFRFQANDGEVSFFDPNGQTGKRFLLRRPLQGGGRIRGHFGMRTHPISRVRKLHTGVDLAASTGTPIFASGDGVVVRAQWVSGYGRFVELRHRNGYSTRYGHMTRIASGMAPGTRVRQGQVIGFVGSTGFSTGPHLHFEIRINSTPVNPLSVQLPRSKALSARDRTAFANTVAQVRDLMQREAAPAQVASN